MTYDCLLEREAWLGGGGGHTMGGGGGLRRGDAAPYKPPHNEAQNGRDIPIKCLCLCAFWVPNKPQHPLLPPPPLSASYRKLRRGTTYQTVVQGIPKEEPRLSLSERAALIRPVFRVWGLGVLHFWLGSTK